MCLNPVSNVIIGFNFSAPQKYFVGHLFLQCCKFFYFIFRILGANWNTNPFGAVQQSLPARKTDFYVHVMRKYGRDVFGYPLRWKAYEDSIWSFRRKVNFVCLNPVSNVIIRFNFSAPQKYFVGHLFLQCCKFLFIIFRILGGKWNTNPFRTDQSLPTGSPNSQCNFWSWYFSYLYCSYDGF